MNKDIIEDSLICLANAKLNDTSYEVARDITLDYITDLQEENKEVNRLWKKTYVIIRNDKELAMNENTYNYLINKETIIDKAIEYIEKEYDENIIICDQYDMPITPQDLYDDLINILKGE